MEQIHLSIVSADGERRVPIGSEPLTIGRHPDNAVVLTDVQASRFHCLIQRTERGFLVKDLDSRNGTRVNGQPVKSAFLSDSDLVTVGATEMRLLAGGRTGAAAAPAAPVAATRQAGRNPSKPDVGNLPPAVIRAQEEESPADMMLDAFLTSEPAEPEVLFDFGVASGHDDDEKFLPVLAESLPDQPFEVGEIALVNARGQVVHAPVKDGKKGHSPAESVSILRYIILICTRARATDIHIEPKQDDFQLRLRIDGNMVDVVRLTKSMGTKLCALVKILCDIDVQYRNIVQEGHFTAVVPGRKIDYRASFLPAMFGQKLVVRVLDAAAAPLHMADLNLPLMMLEELQRVVQQDSGMMLVAGPTGSGKTTTLYAALRDAGTERRNVVTIEDPVEIEIPGATQVPVNEEQGNSFSALLRSMLRQDPDVIMVGEIRDAETARIGMQAAMTGHLVFSTVHARDTISALFRLLDLGIEPYLIASSVQVILSQRLARILCPFCKKAVKPTPHQLEKFGRRAQTVREVFVPKGCNSCLKTGYAGRRGFFEMLLVTDEVREVIARNPTPKDVEIALSATKFMRLHQTGYQLVALGVTPFDEIERAVAR